MKRFLNNDKGQGTVEYTLLIGLVAVVVWAVIANTGIVQTVKGIWGDVDDNMPGGTSPSNVARSSSGGSGVNSGAGAGAGANSGRNSTSVSRNDGGADLQRSAAPHQLAKEDALGEESTGAEDNGKLQEPASARRRRLGGGSNFSEFDWNNLSMGLGLALFVLIGSVIPLIVWMRIKSIEKSEVSYQGLQVDQIVAKIKETA